MTDWTDWSASRGEAKRPGRPNAARAAGPGVDIGRARSGPFGSFRNVAVGVENKLHRLLVAHSVAALRVSIGVTFLGFGVLKFFPHVSPAQGLVTALGDRVTFGLIPGSVIIILVATSESVIGICFLANRWMRVAVWLLAVQLVGILSPIVVLGGRLFSGPHNAPTLEGQYVIKDIVLVAGGMVVAAATFRGGRLVRDEPSPTPPAGGAENFDTDRKIEIVLSATGANRSVEDLCDRHGISQATYYQWRDTLLAGATEAFNAPSDAGGAPRHATTDADPVNGNGIRATSARHLAPLAAAAPVHGAVSPMGRTGTVSHAGHDQASIFPLAPRPFGRRSAFRMPNIFDPPG